MQVVVAAVQCASLNGQPQRNLERASSFVRDAASLGARLILCPEFLATGYTFDESIWDFAELADTGLTETWLARHARELSTMVGASYLEAAGDDFFNTFALFGRDGLLGRVRKQALPVFEGRYFRPCPQPKIIETPIGRVAVGICQDNHTRRFLEHVATMKPDLILMPHSAPFPALPLGALGDALFEKQLSTIAPRYAKALGVPVVLANKASPEAFAMPIPVVPRLRVPMRFRGHSCIVDSDGRTKSHAVDESCALVAEVRFDPARKRTPRVRRGYWSFGPPLLSRPIGGLLELLDRTSQRSYRRNPRRAARAKSRA